MLKTGFIAIFCSIIYKRGSCLITVHDNKKKKKKEFNYLVVIIN